LRVVSSRFERLFGPNGGVSFHFLINWKHGQLPKNHFGIVLSGRSFAEPENISLKLWMEFREPQDLTDPTGGNPHLLSDVSAGNMRVLGQNGLQINRRRQQVHHTERTAIEIIHDHIIERAKELLRNNHYNMSQIAYELGFEYPNNFSKFFKNHTELTPSEFRKNHKNINSKA